MSEPPLKKVKVSGESTSKASALDIFNSVLGKLSSSSSSSSALSLLKELPQANQLLQSEDKTDQVEDDDEDEEPCRKLPTNFPSDYVSSRSSVVQISFSDGKTISPAFVHQVFSRDKLIVGYKGLRILVSYTALWRCLVQIEFDDSIVNEEKWTALVDKDLFEAMKKSGVFEPSSTTRDAAQFQQWLQEDSAVRSVEEKLDGLQLEQLQSPDQEIQMFRCSHVGKTEVGKRFMNRLQAMSLWWIESSEQTDASDSRWSLYLMFQSGQLVGFTTLFVFFNPIRVQQPETWRICQSIIHPLLQGKGLGHVMLTSIYTDSLTNNQAFEMTVEDPCVEFVRLRDRVEVELCLQNKVFLKNGKLEAFEKGIVPRHCLQRTQKDLKLTWKQIQRCYEIIRLAILEHSESTSDKDEDVFRMDVKRRMCAQDVEGILARPQEELRDNLNLLYNDLCEQYSRTLKYVDQALLAPYLN